MRFNIKRAFEERSFVCAQETSAIKRMSGTFQEICSFLVEYKYKTLLQHINKIYCASLKLTTHTTHCVDVFCEQTTNSGTWRPKKFSGQLNFQIFSTLFNCVSIRTCNAYVIFTYVYVPLLYRRFLNNSIYFHEINFKTRSDVQDQGSINHKNCSRRRFRIRSDIREYRLRIDSMNTANFFNSEYMQSRYGSLLFKPQKISPLIKTKLHQSIKTYPQQLNFENSFIIV